MNKLPILSPHAKSHNFTKANISLYQDNSLQKALRVKSKLNCSGSLFKRKEKYLLERLSQREITKNEMITRKKLAEIVKENIAEFNQKQLKQHLAAIKIQKCVRGYLARKIQDENVIKLTKIKATHCINSMQSVVYSMWIDLKYFVKVLNK